MQTRETFPRDILVHDDMGIVMPDECRLSARVWMPKDAESDPVPVILEHLPYRKRDGTIVRDEISHPWMAGHGYAVIRTDMRGSGDSQGLMDDEYTAQELQDACDVIAWAAKQPWCNGNVGMWGISWGGFNGLQTAALKPPALKAVISMCSTVDRYADDIHTKGGCQLVENFGWSSQMLSYSSRPPDGVLVGEEWKDIWLNRLDNQPWHWSTWMRHQRRDAYWKHGSVCENYDAIDAAVLTVGGWHDGYRNTMAHLASNMSAPVKAIAGPWIHKYPHIAGPQPAIGFLQEAKRWWDHWLKGLDTGVENDPTMRAYVMDSLPPQRWWDGRPGRWVAESEWPSPNIEMRSLHLSGDSLERVAGEVERTISSPFDCGIGSGEFFPFAFADEFPDEQSEDDARSLCFDGGSLARGADIVGAPVVRLRLSCDCPQGQIVVRLCDLRPDGTSAFITAGFLNLAHRDSHEFPSEMPTDQSVDVTVTLDQIAYHLPAGHRLRLAVSTSYFPFIWPSADTVVVTVHGGQLDVPERPVSLGDEWTFEPPEGAVGWKRENLRASSYERNVERDETNGVVSVVIECDNGEDRDLDHGLISGSKVSERFSVHPDDPHSARATTVWEQTGGREGALWRTLADSEMWCDGTHFHSKARLRAYLEGEVVFDRAFEDSVERDFV